MKTFIFLLITLCCFLTINSPGRANELYENTQVRSGLVVVVPAGDGSLLTSLGKSQRHLVFGLATDSTSLQQSQQTIRTHKQRGRVSVYQPLSLKRLPFLDRQVNLLVVDLDAWGTQAPTIEELKRVVAPFGALAIKSRGTWRYEKIPLPDGMDEWTHYDYGPQVNPVSKDRFAGPPMGLQWTAIGKRGRAADWSLRMSDGKLYHVVNDQLIARDAFSGVTSWAVKVHRFLGTSRHSTIAADGRVFTMVQPGEPVMALDSETGEVMAKFDAAGTVSVPKRYKNPIPVALAYADNTLYIANGKTLSSLNATTGKLNWAYTHAHYPGYLALEPTLKRIYFIATASKFRTDYKAGDHAWYGTNQTKALVALDTVSGELAWEVTENLYPQVEDLMIHPKHGLFYFTGIHNGPHPHIGVYDPMTGEPQNMFYQREDRKRPQFKKRWPEKLIRLPRDIMALDDGTLEVFGSIQLRRYSTEWDLLQAAGSNAFSSCQSAARSPDFVFTGYGIVFDEEGRVWHNAAFKSSCAGRSYPAYGLSYNGGGGCKCHPRAGGLVASHSQGYFPPVLDKLRLVPGTVTTGTVQPAIAPAPRKVERRKQDGGRYTGKGREDWQTYGRTVDTKWIRPYFNAGKKEAIKGDWDLQDLYSPADAEPVTAGPLSIRVDINGQAVIAKQGEKQAWTFPTSGRLIRQPEIVGDKVVLGCQDGWVYCLNVSDGRLAWKFLAAPSERFLVAQSQVESAWPVPGVAVHDGVVYALAGRHPDTDGGILAWALNVKDGSAIWKSYIHRPLGWSDGSIENPLTNHRYYNDIGMTTPRFEDGLIHIFKLALDAKTGAIVTETGGAYSHRGPHAHSLQ